MAEPTAALPPAIDASPLIFLTKAELLDLLRYFYAEVVVPSAVDEEIRAYGPNDPTARILAQTEWLKVAPEMPIPEEVRSVRLGRGESAVLSWALLHPGTEAILDDLAARQSAVKLGIPVRGTLGLAIAAKQRGYVDAARPLIERLRESGMYLSVAVIDRALALVNE